MAIKVNFEAWVNEIKPTEWGAYLSVSHDRRAKNEQTGEWETVGKDYIDVSVPADLLPRFEGAKIVEITGTVSNVDAYISKDGTAKGTMKVRAKEITPVERRGRTDDAPVTRTVPEAPKNLYGAPEANVAGILGGKPFEDDGMPF